MNQIIESKNGTIITPYRKRQCLPLEKITSIYDKVYHKSKETTGFYVPNYNGMSAFITHGQGTEFLHNLFPTYRMESMSFHRPKKPIPFQMVEGFELREIQKSIATQVITTKRKTREWFINLQTAQGKTVLSTYISSRMGYKVLILCFSDEILKQWASTYQNTTTIDPSRIYRIQGGKALDEIYEGFFPTEDYDVYLSTSTLLTSYLKKTDYGRLYDIMQSLGIGLCIYDEAHRNIADIVKINALSNIPYTIYLSADFAQGDFMREEKYYRMFHKTMVIRPSEEEEQSMRYTTAIVVEFNSHPSEIDGLSIYTRYGYSADLYMSYEIKRGIIFRAVRYVLRQIERMDSPYRILVLMTQVAHVDQMTEYIRSEFPEWRVGRFHGTVPQEERAETKEHAKVIVSTYKSFGTGLDSANIKYIVGLNQSNKVEDNQAAGRCRPLPDGSNAVYFMIIDKGFDYCKKKLQTRLRYLKKTKLEKTPVVFKYHDEEE